MGSTVYHLPFPDIARITEFVVSLSFDGEFVTPLAIGNTPLPPAVPEIDDARASVGKAYFEQGFAVWIVEIKRPLKSASDISSLDRKSTRLNSSHVKTSYAVFCLKKKSEL